MLNSFLIKKKQVIFCFKLLTVTSLLTVCRYLIKQDTTIKWLSHKDFCLYHSYCKVILFYKLVIRFKSSWKDLFKTWKRCLVHNTIINVQINPYHKNSFKVMIVSTDKNLSINNCLIAVDCNLSFSFGYISGCRCQISLCL